MEQMGGSLSTRPQPMRCRAALIGGHLWMLSTHFALALAANAGPDPISFDFGPRGGRDFSMGDDLFAIIHQITTAVGTNGFSDRHLHRGTTVIFFRRHRAIAEFL